MIKISVSDIRIWWNQGNELKPSKSFFDTVTFRDTPNFNVSWVDEHHINVVSPINEEWGLIKIQDDTDMKFPVKYYYLAEILNKTSINKECIYQLDLWTTYILNLDYEVFTTQTLDLNHVPKTINISPTGIATGNVISKSISFDYNYFKADWVNDLIKKTADGEYPIHAGVETNIYYVFLSKETKPVSHSDRSEYKKIKPTNYIAVPVLNWSNSGTVKVYRDVYDATTGDHWQQPLECWVANTSHNLSELVTFQSLFDNNALGKFIGVFVGPNCLRMKNQGTARFLSHKDPHNPFADWYTFSSDILFRPDGFSGQSKPNFISEKGHEQEWHSFIAFGFDAEGIPLFPLKTVGMHLEHALGGMKYLGSENNHLMFRSDKVFFNNGFNFTNGVETETINIEIPVSQDEYHNILKAQKERMNTSLALSAGQALLGVVSSLTGMINPPNTVTKTHTEFQTQRVINNGPELHTLNWVRDADGKTIKRTLDKQKGNKIFGDFTTIRDTTRVTNNPTGMKDYIKSGIGVLGAGLQFFSTYANQQAYKRDLRTQLSSSVTNPNEKYAGWCLMAYNQFKARPIGGDLADLLSPSAGEFVWGAETDYEYMFNFYGTETAPRKVIIKNVVNDYIKITAIDALNLQRDLSLIVSPEIKAGIITMLSNGVRVSDTVI